MTVDDLIRKLSNLPANLRAMQVYTYTQDGYVPLQENPHPTLELGMYKGDQYCVSGKACFPTNPHQMDGDSDPTPAELENVITVINI